MSQIHRVVCMSSVLALAAPAGAEGILAHLGIGKYKTDQLAFKRAREDFHSMLRAEPKLRAIHRRQLPRLWWRVATRGAWWGATAGALVGGSADLDWRKATAGALVGGAMSARAVLGEERLRTRTQTIRLGVEAGAVSPAQAGRLADAELIGPHWQRVGP